MTLAVLVAAVGIGWRAVRIARRREFARAWQQLTEILENERVAMGTSICQMLPAGNATRLPGFPGPAGWLRNLPREVVEQKTFRKLSKKLEKGEPEKVEKVIGEYIEAAVGAFDKAAVLVSHCGAPKLREVFVCEWHAAIIAVWERGQSAAARSSNAVNDVGSRPRRRCFEAVYHEALWTRENLPNGYPRFPFGWRIRRSLRLTVSEQRRARAILTLRETKKRFARHFG